MIAWEPKTTDEPSLKKRAMPGFAGLTYLLALAFPSWAGALLAVYAMFLARFVPKFDAFRIRPR
jgi:hypothetical protein